MTRKRAYMDKKFMKFAKAIDFLRLSRQTTKRLIADKKIPRYKIGRLRIFDRDELIEWVRSHRNDWLEKDGKRGRK